MTHTSSESLQVSGPKCTPNLPLALPLAKETQPLWRAGVCPGPVRLCCHPGNLLLRQDFCLQKRFSYELDMHRTAALEFDKEALSLLYPINIS